MVSDNPAMTIMGITEDIKSKIDDGQYLDIMNNLMKLYHASPSNNEVLKRENSTLKDTVYSLKCDNRGLRNILDTYHYKITQLTSGIRKEEEEKKILKRQNDELILKFELLKRKNNMLAIEINRNARNGGSGGSEAAAAATATTGNVFDQEKYNCLERVSRTINGRRVKCCCNNKEVNLSSYKAHQKSRKHRRFIRNEYVSTYGSVIDNTPTWW